MSICRCVCFCLRHTISFAVIWCFRYVLLALLLAAGQMLYFFLLFPLIISLFSKYEISCSHFIDHDRRDERVDGADGGGIKRSRVPTHMANDKINRQHCTRASNYTGHRATQHTFAVVHFICLLQQFVWPHTRIARAVEIPCCNDDCIADVDGLCLAQTDESLGTPNKVQNNNWIKQLFAGIMRAYEYVWCEDVRCRGRPRISACEFHWKCVFNFYWGLRLCTMHTMMTHADDLCVSLFALASRP